MSSLSALSKDTLESIVSWAEILTFSFTFIGAFSGVAYLVFNRPLKRIEADERRQAETKFEELKADNLELQKSLSPRGFPSPKADIRDRKKWAEEFDALKAKLDELKRVGGITAVVQVIPDFEARRAARVIKTVIEPGWNGPPLKVVDNEAIRDGVVIWKHSAPLPAKLGPGELAARDQAELKSRQAAESLADCLEYFGWQGVSIESGAIAESAPYHIPRDTVLIEVGFKPNLFSAPDWVKNIDKKSRELKQKMKK